MTPFTPTDAQLDATLSELGLSHGNTHKAPAAKTADDEPDSYNQKEIREAVVAVKLGVQTIASLPAKLRALVQAQLDDEKRESDGAALDERIASQRDELRDAAKALAEFARRGRVVNTDLSEQTAADEQDILNRVAADA